MTARKNHLFLIILLGLLLAGCAAPQPGLPAQTAAPAALATPQASPSPRPTQPSGPPTPVAGLSAAGIDLGSIQIDSGALPWQPVVIPAQAYSGSGGSGAVRGWPEHVAVLFGITNPAQWNPAVPFLRIYPVAEYQALMQAGGDERVGEQVARLQELLAGPPPAALDGVMPVLPVTPRPMGRWMQYRPLDTQVGPGVRYLADTPLRPFPGPVTNQDLGYYYQGLTADGKYYLSFYFPVSAPGLPEATQEVTRELAAKFDSIEAAGAYMAELRQQLDSLPPSAFTPQLDLIDKIVQSIKFTYSTP